MPNNYQSALAEYHIRKAGYTDALEVFLRAESAAKNAQHTVDDALEAFVASIDVLDAERQAADDAETLLG